MNFYQETERKIDAEKKSGILKKARNIVLALSCGGIMTSCATGHSYATTSMYRYGNGVYTTTNTYSEVDAAHANYLNAKAATHVMAGLSDLYRAVHWDHGHHRIHHPPRPVHRHPLPPPPPHHHRHHHCR